MVTMLRPYEIWRYKWGPGARGVPHHQQALTPQQASPSNMEYFDYEISHASPTKLLSTQPLNDFPL